MEFNTEFEPQKVRVWFKKLGKIKFISHLDLNRCILHAIKCSKIPVFYTQGFNPHIFITFASPLSLGIEGKNECFDLKLVEPFDLSEIPKKINPWLPQGLTIKISKEPQNNPKSIKFAEFLIKITPKNQEFYNFCQKAAAEIKNILTKDSLIVEKKTKSGNKAINLASEIKKISINFHQESQHITINVILPAGNETNINPILIINLLKNCLNFEFFYHISREALLMSDLKQFY